MYVCVVYLCACVVTCVGEFREGSGAGALARHDHHQRRRTQTDDEETVRRARTALRVRGWNHRWESPRRVSRDQLRLWDFGRSVYCHVVDISASLSLSLSVPVLVCHACAYPAVFRFVCRYPSLTTVGLKDLVSEDLILNDVLGLVSKCAKKSILHRWQIWTCFVLNWSHGEYCTIVFTRSLLQRWMRIN